MALTVFAAATAVMLALLAACGLGAPLLAVARADDESGKGEMRGTAAPREAARGGATPAPAGASPAASPTPAKRAEPDAARVARTLLADEVARRDPELSSKVVEAIREVPRHLFMPDASLEAAYGNHAYPIGHGQTISQPTVVAIMTEALQLTGGEKVLEVGTGSGYQAAVLSRLADEVYSIEIVPGLGEEARRRLEALGYANVHVAIGDGYEGWPEHAPFDRIILTAAPPELPEKLVAQLREGGVLVAPLGDLDQHLYRWTKRDGELSRRYLGAVRFVPMVAGTPGR